MSPSTAANDMSRLESARVFCSYSSADRSRVTGLGLLLEALGHTVFIDHKTITPGARWQASLQRGLDNADALLVYWTASASRSDWVRKEIEYFHGHYPDRLLVPILGDETPLTELLSCYQSSDFVPLINELLEMKRSMVRSGAKPAQIEAAILQRLEQAGIHIDSRQRKKLLRLFAMTGVAGLLSAPALVISEAWHKFFQGMAQLTWGQSVALAVAAISGVVVCSSMERVHSVQQDSVASSAGVGNGARLPGDAWLGMWHLVSAEEAGVLDSFIIERDCDGYRIPVKGVTGDDIHFISEERLRFSEGPAEYDVRMAGAGVAEVMVKSSGSGLESGLRLKRVPGMAGKVYECGESTE